MIEYPKRVLLATDGSEDSDRASRTAVALASNADAELHVIHVWHVGSSSSAAAGTRPPLPGEPPGYTERQARRLLDGQVERIREEGADVAEAHLMTGQPAAEVLALAQRIGADLIMVGGGGPHFLRRAVAATTRRATLGAAAETIVRGAPCPVLVVRGEVDFEEEGR